MAAEAQTSFELRDTLDVSCFAGTAESAAQLVVERARSRRGGYVCFANAHSLTLAKRRADVREALAKSWMVFPDGAPISWLLRTQGVSAHRVAGPDLMPQVMRVAPELRHFLFGSDTATLARLRGRLEASMPNVQIAGAFAPPFGDLATIEKSRGMDAIRLVEPHIVWCAFGAPKQELFMFRNAQRLFPSLLIGVGAAFDFVAGTKARAPMWMQAHALEWLHRLALEPRRLTGRYVRWNAEFAIRAGSELLRRPRG